MTIRSCLSLKVRCGQNARHSYELEGSGDAPFFPRNPFWSRTWINMRDGYRAKELVNEIVGKRPEQAANPHCCEGEKEVMAKRSIPG